MDIRTHAFSSYVSQGLKELVSASYMKKKMKQNGKYNFSTRNMYCWAKILSYIVVRQLLLMLMCTFLPKIYPACYLDVNRIKLGSNSKMTDKHAA